MLVYCKTNSRGSEIKNNCQILVKGKQKKLVFESQKLKTERNDLVTQSTLCSLRFVPLCIFEFLNPLPERVQKRGAWKEGPLVPNC